MFHIGPGELVVILLLALIIFGPGKLPDVGKALGKTINEFRRVTRQVEDEITSEPPRRAEKPQPAVAAATPAPAAGAAPADAAPQGGKEPTHHAS